MQFIMPCQELVCFGTLKAFTVERYGSLLNLIFGVFATALEHLLTGSIEVNLDKLFVFLSKSEKQVDTEKIIASLKFDNNLSNFAVVSATVKETKYFHFNLFSMAKKVNLIALARVLSCIINCLNRNFALI